MAHAESAVASWRARAGALCGPAAAEHWEQRAADRQQEQHQQRRRRRQQQGETRRWQLQSLAATAAGADAGTADPAAAAAVVAAFGEEQQASSPSTRAGVAAPGRAAPPGARFGPCALMGSWLETAVTRLGELQDQGSEAEAASAHWRRVQLLCQQKVRV